MHELNNVIFHGKNELKLCLTYFFLEINHYKSNNDVKVNYIQNNTASVYTRISHFTKYSTKPFT